MSVRLVEVRYSMGSLLKGTTFEYDPQEPIELIEANLAQGFFAYAEPLQSEVAVDDGKKKKA